MSWYGNKMPTTMGELFKTMNQFIMARKPLETVDAPVLRVGTWSSVFGKGGSVKLDVEFDGDSIEMASVKVESNAEATQAREAVADLIEEWNEDPREHWKEAVERSREKVLDHARRQVEEYTEKVARFEAGDWSR